MHSSGCCQGTTWGVDQKVPKTWDDHWLEKPTKRCHVYMGIVNHVIGRPGISIKPHSDSPLSGCMVRGSSGNLWHFKTSSAVHLNVKHEPGQANVARLSTHEISPSARHFKNHPRHPRLSMCAEALDDMIVRNDVPLVVVDLGHRSAN